MLDIVVPVLGRAHQIAPLLDSIAAATEDVPHRVVFVCSPSDTEAREACERSRAQTLVTTWEPGHADFARKVNLAYETLDGEWLFQGATDIAFSPGWAAVALRLAQSGALVIGTNDQGNPDVIRGNHSTHTLIARSYCDDPGASMDGPGTVFSCAYRHQFVDTELVGVAKARGVWAFSAKSIVRHNHPHWGRSSMDEVYELGLSEWERDRSIYNRRRRLWARGAPRRVHGRHQRPRLGR